MASVNFPQTNNLPKVESKAINIPKKADTVNATIATKSDQKNLKHGSKSNTDQNNLHKTVTVEVAVKENSKKETASNELILIQEMPKNEKKEDIVRKPKEQPIGLVLKSDDSSSKSLDGAPKRRISYTKTIAAKFTPIENESSTEKRKSLQTSSVFKMEDTRTNEKRISVSSTEKKDQQKADLKNNEILQNLPKTNESSMQNAEKSGPLLSRANSKKTNTFIAPKESVTLKTEDKIDNKKDDQKKVDNKKNDHNKEILISLSHTEISASTSVQTTIIDDSDDRPAEGFTKNLLAQWRIMESQASVEEKDDFRNEKRKSLSSKPTAKENEVNIGGKNAPSKIERHEPMQSISQIKEVASSTERAKQTSVPLIDESKRKNNSLLTNNNDANIKRELGTSENSKKVVTYDVDNHEVTLIDKKLQNVDIDTTDGKPEEGFTKNLLSHWQTLTAQKPTDDRKITSSKSTTSVTIQHKEKVAIVTQLHSQTSEVKKTILIVDNDIEDKLVSHRRTSSSNSSSTSSRRSSLQNGDSLLPKPTIINGKIGSDDVFAEEAKDVEIPADTVKLTKAIFESKAEENESDRKPLLLKKVALYMSIYS